MELRGVAAESAARVFLAFATPVAERRPWFALLTPICASAITFAIVSSVLTVVVLLMGGAAAAPVIPVTAGGF
jgi:hypothetical protein